MKRILALDVGDNTIGVAVSDALSIIANGVTTIERVGIKKDTGKVIDYVREYDCGTVVVGLPLNLNGSDSVQTEKVRAFKEKLENKLRSLALQDVQVVFQDERFTTKLAEQVLIDGGVRRENRKKYIDKQAAVLILQSYLDSLPHTEG
ncbi:MAG: Holliday junction resolvase RuvX [Firmicutes bacterium]|nr:Holliday junction resolvase RuvX [Bacillota bacterium]